MKTDGRRTNKRRYARRKRRRYSFTLCVFIMILFGVTWLWKNIDTILAQQYGAGSGSFSTSFVSSEETGAGEHVGDGAIPAWLTEKYPDSLRELYRNNPETEDFVKSYFSEKDKHHKMNLSGEVSRGTIPLFLQWDKRWGYEQYGNDMIALTGCGPTCLSMVICGLTGDSSQTPYAVAKQAESAGYYVEGSGSSWTLMSEGAGLFGLRSWEFAFDEQHIRQELRSGHPIICAMRAGDFTTTGHFIVLCFRAGLIFEGGGLDNGDLAGFAVSGAVAALDADSFNMVAHVVFYSLFFLGCVSSYHVLPGVSIMRNRAEKFSQILSRNFNHSLLRCVIIVRLILYFGKKFTYGVNQ